MGMPKKFSVLCFLFESHTLRQDKTDKPLKTEGFVLRSAVGAAAEYPSGCYKSVVPLVFSHPRSAVLPVFSHPTRKRLFSPPASATMLSIE